MIIKTANKNVNVEGSLGIDGYQIQCVPSAIYLGVSIDHNINWKSHIQKVVKSIVPKVELMSLVLLPTLYSKIYSSVCLFVNVRVTD